VGRTEQISEKQRLQMVLSILRGQTKERLIL